MAEAAPYAKIIAGVVTNHLPNASHSAPPAARAWYAYGGVGGETACIIASRTLDDCYDDRSHLFLILRWCSVIVGRIVDVYLSSAFLLVLLPLFTGLGIGYYLGMNGMRTKHAHRLWNGNSIDGNGDSKKCIGSHNDGDKKFWERLSNVNVSLVSIAIAAARWFYNGKFESTENTDTCTQITNKVTDVAMETETENEEERDEKTRSYLKSSIHEQRESGVDPSKVPKHIAVIMDGNRRYGRAKYGSASRGHWSGSKTLVDFSKWCLAEGIEVVTVYAFSTENWNRSASEISTLMNIFCKYCNELRVEALERGICLKVLSTETDKIPSDVAEGMRKMVEDTKHCNKLTLNICLSYGSRGEIVNVCKSIASDVRDGSIDVSEISDTVVASKMLTHDSPDPDLIIRTSGEYRLSNFLLWQLAYSEMFFLKKQWPELTKADLLDVIRTYASGRQRRYGK